MEINRRTLLASGAVAAVWPVLNREAHGADAAPEAVPEGAVILTATVRAKAGEEDAVKEALLSLVEPTRQEPGCVCYNLHQSKKEKGHFMFYEIWANQEALDAHGKTDHMRALGGKLKGRTEKGEVVVFELLG